MSKKSYRKSKRPDNVGPANVEDGMWSARKMTVQSMDYLGAPLGVMGMEFGLERVLDLITKAVKKLGNKEIENLGFVFDQDKLNVLRNEIKLCKGVVLDGKSMAGYTLVCKWHKDGSPEAEEVNRRAR